MMLMYDWSQQSRLSGHYRKSHFSTLGATPCHKYNIAHYKQFQFDFDYKLEKSQNILVRFK